MVVSLLPEPERRIVIDPNAVPADPPVRRWFLFGVERTEWCGFGGLIMWKYWPTVEIQLFAVIWVVCVKINAIDDE